MPSVDTALRATIALVYLEPCCLCGQRADAVGVFMPDEAHAAEFGAPPGKQRMCFYPICDACRETSDAPARVEAVLRESSFRIVRSAP